MKVLIVDDSAAMREMVRMNACDEQDVVVECSNGEDAVESFKKFHPDYVLMDIQMSRTDGLTATERIFKYDSNAKVIIVTNHGSDSFRTAARRAGASNFVMKENLFELKDLLHSHEE
jgi:two-component system chemotaxis response regulator CheY